MKGSLLGRVVANTRSGDPADRLTALLEARGARALSWPTLRFAPPVDASELEAALSTLDRYDWLVLTSPRAVEAVAARTAPVRAPQGYGRRRGDVIVGPRVAAVGPATAALLRAGDWRVDVVGAGGAAHLADEIAERYRLEGTRVLFPASSLAHDRLERSLVRRGARVDRVEAYRTVPAPPDGEVVREDLHRGVDVVTFTSPSAVRALRDALGGRLRDALAGCGIAVIGPTTAGAVHQEGIAHAEVAAEPSLRALVAACTVVEARKRAS